MEIALTVVLVSVGAVALFAGYRMGVKDGYKGGVDMGRLIERTRVQREERQLASPPDLRYLLAQRPVTRALPEPDSLTDVPDSDTVLQGAWSEDPES